VEIFSFGSHLIVDCYGCAKEKLEDVLFIHDVLDALPEKIGLTRISDPHVFRSTAGGEEMTGVSGVVLVAESHISIHTFPETSHVFIDIFSHIDFNTEYASQYLSEVFQSSRHEVARTSHGIEYQPPRERALAIH